jgi:TfoX/Sxy family transcriptional regulator of competence genes
VAYDQDLEARIEPILSGWKRIDRKHMFGGIGYLIDGNMFAGLLREFLILRLGEERSAAALDLPQVKPFDITGRPMKGWVMVAPEGFGSDEELEDWLRRARDFAATLPPK